ncbi:hypothetical protein CMPELA_18725 [Cupriavidus necator]|uniref:Uncharacterized protein n=1 Tax=Cupriavidus necator (strain ATCC 17699 / DSM 428 / KCTC 22496 / NCIMB 10442 / H16 / Stanier 337) TaxID=381666 RepID=A0AAE5ZIF8_CUPNH|nr:MULTISPECIES: hypothetical protein [Cupriavidus]EON19325.1 hypothetical protein C265_12281 [Cupriavidus sp. GA3-3]KUE88179.1 hypothetical protein ASL20_13690 [Cupriavidus necator]QCC02494.1 hypothetical protein E6A55_18895 [Cupriavidus necator H16]QQB78097.1 hypothetical protein I6H87_07265 [Cupriavidus necator]WKA40907.1 hypothetical protein QWP09_18920 [Cupriavidus necator]
MKTNRYALIAVATLAAALSAAPAFAKNGKFDVFTDGAKVAKFDPYTDGARTGKFDPYVDGARTGKFDTYTEGGKYDTTTDRAPL